MKFGHFLSAGGAGLIGSALAWPSEVTFIAMLAGAVLVVAGVEDAIDLQPPEAPRPTEHWYVNAMTGRAHKRRNCATGSGNGANVERVPVDEVPVDAIPCGNCAPKTLDQYFAPRRGPAPMKLTACSHHDLQVMRRIARREGWDEVVADCSDAMKARRV